MHRGFEWARGSPRTKGRGCGSAQGTLPTLTAPPPMPQGLPFAWVQAHSPLGAHAPARSPYALKAQATKTMTPTHAHDLHRTCAHCCNLAQHCISSDEISPNSVRTLSRQTDPRNGGLTGLAGVTGMRTPGIATGLNIDDGPFPNAVGLVIGAAFPLGLNATDLAGLSAGIEGFGGGRPRAEREWTHSMSRQAPPFASTHSPNTLAQHTRSI